MSYTRLQTIVLIDIGSAAREEASFDHRLKRLGKLGYLLDIVRKDRDEDGVIIPARYYMLTKLGRSTLRELQKRRNKEKLLHKMGIEQKKRMAGGDRHTAIRLAKEEEE